MPLSSLQALVDQYPSKAPSATELEAILHGLERQEARNVFKITRLERDKEVATSLLDHAIRDLKAQKARLESINTELKQLMYIASHDLKTPLRSIGSFSNLISRRFGAELPAGAIEYFDYIRVAAESMNNVLNDLVAFNAAGTTLEANQSFHLADILSELTVVLRADISEANASLFIGQLVQVTSHRSAVMQLMQNLIGNAIVYRSYERACQVAVSARFLAGGIQIEVADNGVGLSEGHRERAFKPFQRVGDLSRRGTGMGLAICRRLARQLGGDLDFRSEVGIGTTFYLGLGTLPHLPAEYEAHPLNADGAFSGISANLSLGADN